MGDLPLPIETATWSELTDEIEALEARVSELTAERAAARNAALEEAARTCEAYDDDCGAGDTWKCRFAAMIRALKENSDE